MNRSQLISYYQMLPASSLFMALFPSFYPSCFWPVQPSPVMIFFAFITSEFNITVSMGLPDVKSDQQRRQQPSGYVHPRPPIVRSLIPVSIVTKTELQTLLPTYAYVLAWLLLRINNRIYSLASVLDNYQPTTCRPALQANKQAAVEHNYPLAATYLAADKPEPTKEPDKQEPHNNTPEAAPQALQ